MFTPSAVIQWAAGREVALAAAVDQHDSTRRAGTGP
jgi:hypothetical protein